MRSLTITDPRIANRNVAGAIAREALRSLHAELTLYPKPGLVSPVDNGSHGDMNAVTFLRSLFSLRGYFVDVATAGMAGAGFAVLAGLGIAAERRMLVATGGINTHRGAIFCLGLLCAAAGHVAATSCSRTPLTAQAIREALLQRWAPALVRHCQRRMPATHGTQATIVHGIGGARAQAAAGLPAVFETALPVMLQTLQTGRSLECARIDAFFALLATLDDSNVYHRGGAAGAQLVRRQGEIFKARGGTADPQWRATALASHRLLVSRRLSPGGAADLLAATCMIHALTGASDQRLGQCVYQCTYQRVYQCGSARLLVAPVAQPA